MNKFVGQKKVDKICKIAGEVVLDLIATVLNIAA
jgi:hypothetical protein